MKQGLDPQEPAMLRGNIAAATEAPQERARIWTNRDGLSTETVVDSIRGNWTSYYQNVCDALEGRRELAVRPEEARRALTIFEAAQASAATHEPVRPRQ